MSAGGKYSLVKRDNLTQPIQMPKTKNFFLIFCCFFEIWFKFWTFSKKRMTLTPEVFPKLRTPKNMVTSMSKNSRLNGTFGKQHGKRPQTLLKLSWQHLYHIYWSLWRQLTYKISMLVICKTSRLFPNRLSGDGKYSLLNRDNLTEPIQMQVSPKKKLFLDFFLHFLNLVQILNIFKKKHDSHSWCISEIMDSKKHGYINV